MENYTIAPVPAATKQMTRVAYHIPAYSHYTPSDELKDKVLSAGRKAYPHLYELIKDCERGRSKFINPEKRPEQPLPEGQVWLYDSFNNEWFARHKKPLPGQKEAVNEMGETRQPPAKPSTTTSSCGCSNKTSTTTTVLGKRKVDEAAALPTPPLTPPRTRQAAKSTTTRINHSEKKIILLLRRRRVRRRQPNSLFFKPTHMGLHRDNNECMAGKRPEGFHQVVGQRAKEAMAVVHKDQLRISGRGSVTKVMTRQFRARELYETTAKEDQGPGMKEKLEEETRKMEAAAAVAAATAEDQ